MLDHISVHVSNYEASKAWYSAALKPLGVRVLKEVPEAKACGFGTTFPSFWIAESCVLRGGAGGGGGGGDGRRQAHFAFQAPSRAGVRQFHAAALAAGGRDNGGPGFRPQYHPMYYGAFVLDPDGYNVEAVKHMPEGLAEWFGLVVSVLRAALQQLLAAVRGLAPLGAPGVVKQVPAAVAAGQPATARPGKGSSKSE
ncbi:hypothetical protein HXX76_003749 [Chlamydomonas incerta]|uniref:VOC domain-containing protein n=1 Tax=Chlamydomonas incerta TaxID=51695 RepID=A0A835TL73_CHLIN|nr:hypothetical protein HXX76_003749 [Chlamydomonas incerta]|eukprot:KAG2440895.1 hypothetical protein HXX76_003749 [Chlamydomonas incerta]